MADDPRDEPGEGPSEEEFRDMLRDFLSGDSELDPARLASAAGLPDDPELVQRLIGQLQQALQNSGEGINWGLALEQAKGLAQRSAVPSTPAEQSALEQALHVAALWLDETTDIAALTAEPVLLTRAGWTEATMPVWTQLAEPVATSIANALTGVLEEQAPEELAGMLGNAGQLMRNVGGTLFAMQLGQVVGQLAGEVVSGGDVGIPLLDGEQRQAALVAQNVDAFAAGLDIPVDEVRLYLAVRELAHARLFRHAKWLRLNLMTQITDFARGIRIDTDRLEQLASDFDPSNPEELRAAVVPRADPPSRPSPPWSGSSCARAGCARRPRCGRRFRMRWTPRPATRSGRTPTSFPRTPTSTTRPHSWPGCRAAHPNPTMSIKRSKTC
jgi:uncharacterized protein (DUF2342 family)